MNSKKVTTVVMCLFIVLSIVACNSKKTVSNSSEDYSAQSNLDNSSLENSGSENIQNKDGAQNDKDWNTWPDNNYVENLVLISDEKHVGREGRIYYNKTKGGYEFSNTASGFKVRFRGKKLYAELSGSLTETVWSKTYVSIKVDGVITDSFYVEKDKRAYLIYSSAQNELHTIEILKRTESQYTDAALYSLFGNGTFYKVMNTFEKKIVFYGDSITCGYGNIGIVSSNTYIPEVQDGLQTYATYCAKKLNADIDIFAGSGWAINRTQDRTEGICIPSVFCNYSIKNSEIYLTTDSDMNYAVVNLGTNDFAYYQSHTAEISDFVHRYEAFYDDLRIAYPNAQIVLAYGMMQWGNLTATIKNTVEQVERYAKNKGDNMISTVKLYTAKNTEDYGSGKHPTILAHNKAGEELYSHILNL